MTLVIERAPAGLPCRLGAILLLGGMLANVAHTAGAAASPAEPPAGPHDDGGLVAAVESAIAAGEASLRAGEHAAAKSHYRRALFHGWLILSRLDRLDGQPEDAALRLQKAEAEAPEDPQAAFLLATEYLWLGQVPSAERLFARLVESLPAAETLVLVGRVYRDAGEYGRARSALQAALERDPAVRRAHYYLGMTALAEAKSADRFRAAETEFREELKLAPQDPLARAQLGQVLLDAARPEAALPFLEASVEAEPRRLSLSRLGRCLLALDRPAEAVAFLSRALELAPEPGEDAETAAGIHFQLGQALRRQGHAADAERHLAEANRLARARLEPAGRPAEAAAADAAASPEPSSQARRGLRERASASLAKACFNLGVLEAQSREPAAERFARAAERFEQVALLDPEFPQLQSSLGVAYFNARQFEKATGPLARALARNPSDLGLKRMLATAWLDTRKYQEAAALLKDDPGLATIPHLAFAYGLALLGLGYAAEAVDPLETAARLAPEDAEVAQRLAEAYRAAGQEELAAQQLARSRELQARR